MAFILTYVSGIVASKYHGCLAVLAATALACRMILETAAGSVYFGFLYRDQQTIGESSTGRNPL